MPTTLSPVEHEPRRASAATDGGRLGGVFPDAASRDAMLALYDAKLAEWPVDFEELDVPTRYGRTHVIAAGSASAPPLVLLHMHACTSFIWAPLIAPLAEHFRVFAVDTIGDVNKSLLDDPARRPKTGDEMAVWLSDVTNALGVERSDVIAGSYGGWIGMHYATYAPARVRRLVLLVPMGLPSWLQTVRVLFRLSTIVVGLSAAKLERALSFLMGDDPAMRHLAGDWFTTLFMRKLRTSVPSPTPVRGRRLEAIRMPTLVILGGRDPLIGDATSAARRARAHVPDVEIEIVPNGTHAVHGEEPARVAGRIIEFLER